MKKIILFIILSIMLSCKTYNTVIYIDKKTPKTLTDTIIIEKKFKLKEHNRFDKIIEDLIKSGGKAKDKTNKTLNIK